MRQPCNRSAARNTAQNQSRTPPRARQKDLERVNKGVEQATDIRQERVVAAKLALKEGKLKLRGIDLAEKVLADPLNQKSL